MCVMCAKSGVIYYTERHQREGVTLSRRAVPARAAGKRFYEVVYGFL
jgi:hypothetical protein